MHFSDGNGFVEDHEGQELPSDDAARSVAIAAARDMMASDLREGRLDFASFIEVEDEVHNLLFTVPFGDAVEVIGRR